MRLKQDHSGYSSSGLWLKYNQSDPRSRLSKKKPKPCLHEWHKYEVYRYKRTRWGYNEGDPIGVRYEIVCSNCGKEKSVKSSKTLKTIFHPMIQSKNEPTFVQIKINGEYLPLPRYITRPRSEDGFEWCYECNCYH